MYFVDNKLLKMNDQMNTIVFLKNVNKFNIQGNIPNIKKKIVCGLWILFNFLEYCN